MLRIVYLILAILLFFVGCAAEVQEAQWWIPLLDGVGAACLLDTYVKALLEDVALAVEIEEG